jgi:hypothetical protein
MQSSNYESLHYSTFCSVSYVLYRKPNIVSSDTLSLTSSLDMNDHIRHHTSSHHISEIFIRQDHLYITIMFCILVTKYGYKFGFNFLCIYL